MEKADCPNLELQCGFLQLPFTMHLVTPLLSWFWINLERGSGARLMIHLKTNLGKQSKDHIAKYIVSF